MESFFQWALRQSSNSQRHFPQPTINQFLRCLILRLGETGHSEEEPCPGIRPQRDFGAWTRSPRGLRIYQGEDENPKLYCVVVPNTNMISRHVFNYSMLLLESACPFSGGLWLRYSQI